MDKCDCCNKESDLLVGEDTAFVMVVRNKEGWRIKLHNLYWEDSLAFAEHLKTNAKYEMWKAWQERDKEDKKISKH